MPWKVNIKESAVDDLRWFGTRDARTLLKTAVEHLTRDPTEETKNMKSLRPNKVAQRELRVFGRYRILFNVDGRTDLVTVIAVGEKRGNKLIIQGKEFTAHEGDPTE